MSTDHTHDAGESLLAILDEMRRMVTQARSMPMSSSAIVNRAELLDMIASARSVVPESIAAADSIVADADAVLERARSQADQIVADGEAEAARLVQMESVLDQARAEAARIIEEAEGAAQRRAQDADAYANQQLGRFENELAAISSQVRAGRQYLEKTSGLPQAAPGEPPVADTAGEGQRPDGQKHRPTHAASDRR
ncbi:MAG: ATPase [Actinomycetaceae bacterium]|nr:Cell division initiation protein [Actinomycetales bacterium JB111]